MVQNLDEDAQKFIDLYYRKGFSQKEIFKVMEKNKDIKPKLKKMNISHKAELSNGEVILQINGIKIKHKIQGKNL